MIIMEKLARTIAIFLYNAFYRTLAFVSKMSYRYEARKLYLKKSDKLTKTQREQIKNYWKQYTKDFDITFHNYYINRTGVFDVRFIPDDLFAGYIDVYLNNREIENGIADKNYFDMYLRGFRMPETYIHLINGHYLDANYNIITRECAINILVSHGSFTVKPSMISYGGKNVCFFENVTRDSVQKYLENTPSDNLLFQETIKQSSATAILHPTSVNTIRIMTLIIDGEVRTLHSSLRIGIGNSKVDNASSGGIYCGIKEDGTLTNYAYDAYGNKFHSHPNGGEFSNCRLPFMDKVREIVIAAAQRLPHFRLIGWDIAINENNEPIIIEANLTMSGLDVIQTICGPVFGEYTDAVLNEVFKKKTKKKPYIDIDQYI